MPYQKLKRYLTALPFVVLVAGMAIRIVDLQQRVAEIIQCRYCIPRYVVAHDLFVVALVAASLWLSMLVPNRLLRIVFRLLMVLLVLAYVLDITVTLTLGTRLFFSDLSIYAVEWGPIWDHVRGISGGAIGALLILLMLAGVTALMMLAGDRTSVTSRRFILALAVLAFSLNAFFEPPQYIHGWRFKNYFFANFATAEAHRYSAAYVSELNADGETATACLAGLGRRPNIVLLLVESWSQYHSQLFSGLNDWTPELDKIAKKHAWYSQFFANGFTTNTGLVSSLTPIQLDAPFQNAFLRDDSFQGTWAFERSLPGLVAQFGYRSAFLTTGPLGFTNKGDWLDSLGFDFVEGNDGHFYKDWPKVQFHAATDEALFLRAQQWMGEQTIPYALVLENVSTHQPYIDPLSGERSLEKAFRYVDQQIMVFYKDLLKSDFFANGVMIIASDHRAMNLVTAEELEKYGLQAVSRVPMILIDPRSKLTGENKRITQQSDIYYSIRHLLQRGQVCPQANEVSLYTRSETPSKCALHLRGTQKGVVDVTCEAGDGQVILDGDQTRFIWSKGLTPAQQRKLLLLIARQRLALLNNTAGKALSE